MSRALPDDDVNLGALRSRVREMEERLLSEVLHEIDLLQGELGVRIQSVSVDLANIDRVGELSHAVPVRVRVSVEL